MCAVVGVSWLSILGFEKDLTETFREDLTCKLVCISKILSQSWNSGQGCVLLEIGSLGSIPGGLIKVGRENQNLEGRSR